MIAEVRAPSLANVSAARSPVRRTAVRLWLMSTVEAKREVETVRHRRSAIAEQVPLVGPDPHDEGVASLLR